MKFKDLLEKQNSSGTIIENMLNYRIPISPKFIDSIIGKKEKIHYFHTMAIGASVGNLAKLQNTKKQISAFDVWNKNDILTTGAENISYTYTCTAVLYGDYTLKLGEDLWTERDSIGRRWIDPYEMTVSNSYAEMFQEIGQELMDFMNDGNSGILMNTGTDKELQVVIKNYFDLAYKLLEKNKNKFKAAIGFNHLTGSNSYNEILAHSFKIIEILYVRKEDKNFDDYLDEAKKNNKNLKFVECKDYKELAKRLRQYKKGDL